VGVEPRTVNETVCLKGQEEEEEQEIRIAVLL
jgi:hypothetical protein